MSTHVPIEQSLSFLLGELKTELVELRKGTSQNWEEIKELKAHMAEFNEVLHFAKGGLKVLLLLGSGAAAIGGLIFWLINYFVGG